MIGIPLGLAYASIFEVVAHKYVLHGLGKRPGNFFNFHWREHHRAARLNEFRDPHYERSLLSWNAQSKEALALAALTVVHLPLAPDMDANWGVSVPWIDNLIGTRRRFVDREVEQTA